MASTTISSSLQATTFRVHLHLWTLVTHNTGRDNRNLPKMGGFSWPITDSVSPNMPLACSLISVYTLKRPLGRFF